MNKERFNPKESKTIRIGESNKSVILIEIDEEKALLVTPDGVGVWQEIRREDNGGYESRRLQPVEAGLYRIGPGKFIVRDVELEEKNEVAIKFSSNSDDLKKAA